VAYLDDLQPAVSQVSWGGLGLRGELGYEGKHVRVQGASYGHAISAHPPSRVVFTLESGYRSFHASVAINDDVPPGLSHADFSVVADGTLVAFAARVTAGGRPIPLVADITGTSTLELRVDSTRLAYAHAAWLDARLEPDVEPLVDCLGRVEFGSNLPPRAAKRCIATVATPNFADFLDDFLGSLRMNGGAQDDLIVVLGVDPDERMFAIARAHDATLIRCRGRRRPDASIKAALYSIARAVSAEQYFCLDADMLVLADLDAVFSALEVCPSGSVLACADQNQETWENLGHALVGLYRGSDVDLARLLGASFGEAQYRAVLNDGAFAGDRRALLALDSAIRAMPGAPAWVDAFYLRNQFVFNLALARMRCAVPLSDAYNLQLHAQDVQIERKDEQIQATWQGRPVRVLHFNAAGRSKYPGARGIYARVAASDRATPLP
jgi:hypothetical protein